MAEYGSRTDQIDDFFRSKREWSKVKDKIVGDYLTCYLKTIQHRRSPIILVDAFAGPGQFGDGADGSPVIICRTIQKQSRRSAGIGCLFADIRPGHRDALRDCIAEYIQLGIAEAPFPDFATVLARALEIGANATLFFYLDPWGIKELDFATVRQIYGRDARQSTEVLINFSFPTFMRMSGNWSYADTADEVAQKVKQAKVETVDGVMGGDYWRAIVTDPKLSKTEREDAVLQAYLDRVRAYLPLTFSIPVKVVDNGCSVPDDDIAKYHLIFGTRSAQAVVYMNDVANIALTPYFNQFRDGLLFPMLPGRYQPAPAADVKAAIIRAVGAQPLRRPQIYEATVQQFFLQYRTKDYRKMIDDLVFVERKLYADPRTVKRKGMLNDDTYLGTVPWPEAVVT